MTTPINPTTLDSQYGIETYSYASGDPNTIASLSGAVVGSEATNRATGDFYKRQMVSGSATWVLMAAASGAVSWSSITGKPTTVATSGLTDALSTSAAAGIYQTISGMSSYLTTSAASTTYQTQSGMSAYLTTSAAAAAYQTISGMSSYLTTSAASTTYMPKSGGTFTGAVSGTSLVLSGALTIGGNFKGTRLGIQDNLVNEVYTNGNANLAFNYYGYNFSTTQFRDFSVYDGKSSNIFYITGSTKAAVFTGNVTAPLLNGFGSNSAAITFQAAVTGDSYARGYMRADGYLAWGPGTATADTNLYRAAAAALKTDGAFFVGGVLYVGAAATARTTGDINARRSATTGAYYFGDDKVGGGGGSAYLYWNGTAYQFGAFGSTAPVQATGSLEAVGGQVRGTGWYNGNESAGLALEMGIASSTGVLVTYNRSTSAYGSLTINATTLTMQAASGGSLTGRALVLNTASLTYGGLYVPTIQFGTSAPTMACNPGDQYIQYS